MSTPGIEIDFTDKGQDKIVQNLLRQAEAAEKAANAMERLGQAGRPASLPGPLGNPLFPVPPTDSYPPASPGRPPRVRQGPNERIAALHQEMAKGVNDDRLADIELEMRGHQRRIDRDQKQQNGPGSSSVADKVVSLLRTSRFGAGGLMPLVGKTLDLLGPAGTAVGALATGAEKAAEALYDMTSDAASAGRAFQGLSFAGGGSTAETSKLAGIGSALGMSPDQMGQMAQSFNTRITTDPMAMGYGGMLGVQNSPGQFGNQDWSGQLLRAIENLRRLPRDQQLLAARNTGLESILPYTKLSGGTMDRLQGDSNLRTGIFSDDFQTKSLEFQVSVSRMSDSADNLKAAVTGPLMGSVTFFQNELANLANGTAGFIQSHQAAIEGAVNASGGGLGAIVEMLLHATGGDAAGQQVDATNKNTAAIQQQTALMQQGAYGNGERFRQVTSDIQGGDFLRRSLEAGGFALGAF